MPIKTLTHLHGFPSTISDPQLKIRHIRLRTENWNPGVKTWGRKKETFMKSFLREKSQTEKKKITRESHHFQTNMFLYTHKKHSMHTQICIIFIQSWGRKLTVIHTPSELNQRFDIRGTPGSSIAPYYWGQESGVNRRSLTQSHRLGGNQSTFFTAFSCMLPAGASAKVT